MSIPIRSMSSSRFSTEVNWMRVRSACWRLTSRVRGIGVDFARMPRRVGVAGDHLGRLRRQHVAMDVDREPFSAAVGGPGKRPGIAAPGGRHRTACRVSPFGCGDFRCSWAARRASASLASHGRCRAILRTRLCKGRLGDGRRRIWAAPRSRLQRRELRNDEKEAICNADYAASSSSSLSVPVGPEILPLASGSRSTNSITAIAALSP